MGALELGLRKMTLADLKEIEKDHTWRHVTAKYLGGGGKRIDQVFKVILSYIVRWRPYYEVGYMEPTQGGKGIGKSYTERLLEQGVE